MTATSLSGGGARYPYRSTSSSLPRSPELDCNDFKGGSGDSQDQKEPNLYQNVSKSGQPTDHSQFVSVYFHLSGVRFSLVWCFSNVYAALSTYHLLSLSHLFFKLLLTTWFQDMTTDGRSPRHSLGSNNSSNLSSPPSPQVRVGDQAAARPDRVSASSLHAHGNPWGHFFYKSFCKILHSVITKTIITKTCTERNNPTTFPHDHQYLSKIVITWSSKKHLSI